jgi:hypothetical protein
VAPKNNNSKPGGERLWKSRSVEKSRKRTFPLRLEIRTHRGFPLYTQPRLLLENKKCTTTTKEDISNVLNKGTFLMSVDKDHCLLLTKTYMEVGYAWKCDGPALSVPRPRVGRFRST